MKLNETMILAIINLVARLGIEAALAILRSVGKPEATLADAIAALEAASKKTAADYLREAREKLPPGP